MYSNFKLWYNGCAYSLPTLTALNFWTSESSCWWFVALWKSHAKTSVNVGGVPVRISNFHKRQQIMMKKKTLEKDTPYSFTNYPYFVCFSGLVVGGWFMDQRNPTKSDQAHPCRSTLDKAQGSQRCRRHWRFASVPQAISSHISGMKLGYVEICWFQSELRMGWVTNLNLERRKFQSKFIKIPMLITWIDVMFHLQA